MVFDRSVGTTVQEWRAREQVIGVANGVEVQRLERAPVTRVGDGGTPVYTDAYLVLERPTQYLTDLVRRRTKRRGGFAPERPSL